MAKLLDELPNLIVTISVLIMVTVLLVLKIIPTNDTIITATVPIIVSYWFLQGAFKYQPTNAVGTAITENTLATKENTAVTLATAPAPMEVPPTK